LSQWSAHASHARRHDRLVPFAPPLCWSCRAPAARGAPLCACCRARLRFLDGRPLTLSGVRVWAVVAYEGPARDLVLALKYRAAAGLAGSLAAFMAQSAALAEARGAALTEAQGAALAGALAGTRVAALAGARALVPVPLHPARRRLRGFNQAELLARALARRTGLPVAACLRRSGPDRRQVGRGRGARLSGPSGSVAARGRAPPRALLVDDVVTTGATLGACARALRESGAVDVAAVVFARTPGR
jgi:predicted amidophosphoribosyltransferase